MPRSFCHLGVAYYLMSHAEIWKPSSLAFKQDKLWGDFYDPAPCGDQAEAGTCPEGSLLFSIFSFPVLLPRTPLLVSPGNNSSVNYLPREPDLTQFHLSAHLSIPKATALVYYLLCNHFL